MHTIDDHIIGSNQRSKVNFQNPRGENLVHTSALLSVLPYKWLFSRVVYFTNGPSFSISRILISPMAAGDHIFVILAKYFKILYFTN